MRRREIAPLRPGELRDVDAAFNDLQHAVDFASRRIAPRTVTTAPTSGPARRRSSTFGMRTGEAANFEAAASACREALRERRLGETPLDSAETRHVLGMTLRSLGADADGTGTLEAAVQALTEALKERTPARAPLGCVQTLTGLGVAYSLLRRCESGVARRRETVQATR